MQVPKMREKILLLCLCAFISACFAAEQSWRPIVPVQISSSIIHHETVPYGNADTHEEEEDSEFSHSLLLSPENREQCSIYKVGMSQQLYFEYIHYKIHMPAMKEFTLCMWTKFTNHSNDHPLFSYAVGDQARGILYWVANTQRSSYFMLNVDGHNLYRLNYPLRLNKWYHSCTSWNGRSGEWQIWVNDERVGRGYNNRLVGHIIKGGGIAITGQEQRQLGGGFLEGDEAPKGSGGLLGEITMLQLYNVALSAGKAHKDHKHHHVHHFEHDTSNREPPTTTTPAPVQTAPPAPSHPFLTAGQINHRVKINPGAHLQIVKNGVTLRHPLLPPPQSPAPQPLPPAKGNLPVHLSVTPGTPFAAYKQPPVPVQFFPASRLPHIQDHSISLDNVPPVNGFNFVDRRYRDVIKVKKIIIKRDNDKNESSNVTSKAIDLDDGKKITKRDVEKVVDDKISFVPSKKTEITEEKIDLEVEEDTRKKRRGIFQLSDGSLVDDSYIAPQSLDSEYFSGLTSFGVQPEAETEPVKKEDEREPAEAEVKLIMDICDGCTPDPFPKALVMGWRSVPKKVYSGALLIPAVPYCKSF